jgi:hypothetical protein
LTRAREGRADLSAVSATRWRRLPIAVADSLFSGWGRTMELGRSGRTLMLLRPPAELRGIAKPAAWKDQAFS